MIEGVVITKLQQFLDERGKVMRMLRNDDDVFVEFGEVYFSIVYPNVIKGWHLHNQMTLNYAVPFGNIKFVIYDDRPESKTRGELQEIYLGPDNYYLVTVPPLVWNGFKGIGQSISIVANCATIPHDPSEINRIDPFDSKIPYDWDIKNG